MSKPSDEFALLLEAVGPVDTDLARELLEEKGIPCLVHGPDFDLAELGVASHQTLRGANLYVPKAALEQARAAIEAAWGEGTTSAPSSGGDGGDS